MVIVCCPGYWFLGLSLRVNLVIVSPNNSKVSSLFGAYKGSIKQNGLFLGFPVILNTFYLLKSEELESEKIKVNDKLEFLYQ